MPGAPTRARLTPLAEDVWKAELEDGRALVAKHQVWGFLTAGQPYDLLQVEQQVLGLLHCQGCPVPRVEGIDPQGQFIFLEYCGSHTLEDLAGDCRPYIPQVVEGLLQIDQAFCQHRELLARRVVPQASIPCLQQAWARASLQARQGLEQLGRQCHCPPAALEGAQQALAQILEWLAARPPALGTTDYNPRNITVDPERGQVRFIEFAKIGWDWTERRLVQYTNTVKRGFCRLLDPSDVEFYAGQVGQERARALDYHHLAFYLNAASRLGAALAAPQEHAALRRAWGPPQARLRQLAELMAAPLSSDPLAARIREIFM